MVAHRFWGARRATSLPDKIHPPHLLADRGIEGVQFVGHDARVSAPAFALGEEGISLPVLDNLLHCHIETHPWLDAPARLRDIKAEAPRRELVPITQSHVVFLTHTPTGSQLFAVDVLRQLCLKCTNETW